MCSQYFPSTSPTYEYHSSGHVHGSTSSYNPRLYHSAFTEKGLFWSRNSTHLWLVAKVSSEMRNYNPQFCLWGRHGSSKRWRMGDARSWRISIKEFQLHICHDINTSLRVRDPHAVFNLARLCADPRSCVSNFTNKIIGIEWMLLDWDVSKTLTYHQFLDGLVHSGEVHRLFS